MRVPIRLHSFSKYHSKREGKYASRKEANYAAKLLAWLKLGEIHNFEEQVRFELIAKDELGKAVVYVADFVYDDRYGHHVIDVKGFRTKEYILKRRLMWRVHGIKIEEV